MKFLKPEKNIKLEFSNIFKIKYFKDYFLVLTYDSFLYKYNYELKELLRIKTQLPKPLNKFNSKLNESHAKMVDFNDIYYAVVISDNVYIINIYTKKVILKIDPNFSYVAKTKDVNCIALNESSIIIGTDLGRNIEFSLKGVLINIYNRFSDSVEYINIGNKYIAMGSFDSRIRVYDKYSKVLLYELKSGISSPVSFIKEEGCLLYIGFKNGFIVLLNIVTKETKTLNLVRNSVFNIDIVNSNIFITYLGRKSIVIFNMETKKEVRQIFNNSIISYNKDNMLFFTENYILKYKDIESQVLSKLNGNNKNDLKEFDFLIRNNFFINNKEKFKEKFEEKKEVDKENSIKLLRAGYINESFKLLEKYTYDSTMQKYQDDLETYEQDFSIFQKAYNNKNYYTCYQLINKKDYLRYTSEFKNMELLFSKIFQKIYKDPNFSKNIEKINILLQPYKAVQDKKEAVQYILNKSKVIYTFNFFIEKGNFEQAYKIANENKFLESLETYKDLDIKINGIINKLHLLKNNEDIIRKIERIPKYRDKIKEIKEKITDYNIFIDKVRNGRPLDKINMDNDFILNSSLYLKEVEPFFKIVDKLSKNIEKITRGHVIKFLKDYQGEFFNIYKINLCIDIYRNNIINFIGAHKENDNFSDLLYKISRRYIKLCGEDQFIKDIMFSNQLITKEEYLLPAFTKTDIKIEELPNILIKSK